MAFWIWILRNPDIGRKRNLYDFVSRQISVFKKPFSVFFWEVKLTKAAFVVALTRKIGLNCLTNNMIITYVDTLVKVNDDDAKWDLLKNEKKQEQLKRQAEKKFSDIFFSKISQSVFQ